MDQKELASKIGVSEGRVSQVLNGDGNLRTAAIARYLRALGYKATLSAQPVEAGRQELPRRRRRRMETEERQTIPVEYQATSVARFNLVLMEPRPALDVSKLALEQLHPPVLDVRWIDEAIFHLDVHDPGVHGRVRRHESDEAWAPATADPRPGRSTS